MEDAESKRFIYQFGKFTLDPQEKILFENGKPLHLPAKEFETLLLLVGSNGKVLSKEEMLAAVWHESFVEEGNLAKKISNLRKIFNDDPKIRIETIPKHGYRFSAQVIRTFAPEKEIITETQSVKRTAVQVEDRFAETPLVLESAKPQTSRRAIFAAFGLAILTVAFAGWYWNRSTDPAKINSVAVLPIRFLTPSENNQALGLGLTDTLIMKIGGLRQIIVRPISAVTPYSDTAHDSLEIGKKLRVDAVLEGTIQQSDGRIRINVRLLRVENGEQIWAENFDGTAAEIFDLEEQLSEQTARALKLKLGTSENEQITKRFTGNREALDAYQKGRFFWNRRTANDIKIAISYFQEAVRIDPNYALAFAGLADAYSLFADYGGEHPSEAYPKAKESAMKALQIDDNLAEAHTALAYVQMYYYRDWQDVENEYRRAISLNPNYATAHQW